MTQGPEDAARDWSQQLPREFAHRLAAALRAGTDHVRLLRADAVLPASAAAVRAAEGIAANGDGGYTAGLLAARLAIADEQPHITPVWTGPYSDARFGRLTLAVLSDLIDEAQEELLLVSYATLPSADIRTALQAAVARNVEITLLLERPVDNPQFHGHGDPFPDLPATRLFWPAGARPHGASMHAKLLVVDRRLALVGSANLTGYGLERNLECGLLVRGGAVPTLLAEHLLSAEGLHTLDTL